MGHTTLEKSVHTRQLAKRIASELCIPYFRVRQVMDAEFEIMKKILLNGQNVVINNFIQLKPCVYKEKIYFSKIGSDGFLPNKDKNEVRIVPEHLRIRLETSEAFKRLLIEAEIPKLVLKNNS